MKFEIILLAVCIIIGTDAFRVTREAKQNEGCCYPPPPPNMARGLKGQVGQCCEFPVSALWEKFYEDLENCKKAKKENEGTSTTTTTQAPAEKENETDNGFSADLPENDEAVGTGTAAAPQERRGHSHGHGRGKGGKHRGGPGRGRCLRETMQKHGWSNNGTILWDAILAATEKASNQSADKWVPIVREAITNCSKSEAAQANDPEKEHGRHHCPYYHMASEKLAWRCVINNSIMKCPDFPTDNAYCLILQNAHANCLATQSSYGHFNWCGGHKHPETGN